MKLSYYRLQEHLDEGKLARTYIVVGNQDLLRELAIKALSRRGLGGEPTPFSYDPFDGEEADGARIAMSANMLPMLGGRRVVVVKRAQKLLEKSAELTAYLNDPSPQTLLVLELSKTPDKRRKAWKEVEKLATVVECEAPQTRELEQWAAEQAGERGLRLGRDGVRYLVEEFGTDLRRLLGELEKLSLYSGRDKLDLETIATVLGRGKAQSIFKFVEAVGAGHTTKALQQLGRLLEEGEPPLKILALVDRLVGQLRVARELQSESRRGGESLARVLGVPPFAAKSLADAARRFDESQLAQARDVVARTDRVLKSSAIPSRLILESLTIALCARSGGRGGGGTSPLARGGRG
jgi:DNA polymerase-3 subunit delta